MTIDWEELTELYEEGENVGACLECGEVAEGVEQDAREYECESCGCHKVYGVEEIFLLGLMNG